MQTTRLYPLLLVRDVAATAAFYISHLGFVPVFAANWYVHLRSSHAEQVELAIIAHDHDTIPEQGRQVTAGILLSFEVKDAEVEHARMVEQAVTIIQPLRDEPFGQRHFIARDPNGVLLDIITPIDADPEWLAAQAS